MAGAPGGAGGQGVGSAGGQGRQGGGGEASETGARGFLSRGQLLQGGTRAAW